MSIKTWILKKLGGVPAPKRHVLTDEDRERGQFTKQLQSKVRNLEKQAELALKLEKVHETFNPKQKPEDMFATFLMQALMNPNSQNKLSQSVEQPIQEYSDSEIKSFLYENRPYVEKAKKLSDEQIEQHIRTVAPTITENSVHRAIKMIREDF